MLIPVAEIIVFPFKMGLWGRKFPGLTLCEVLGRSWCPCPISAAWMLSLGQGWPAGCSCTSSGHPSCASFPRKQVSCLLPDPSIAESEPRTCFWWLQISWVKISTVQVQNCRYFTTELIPVILNYLGNGLDAGKTTGVCWNLLILNTWQCWAWQRH